MPNKTLYLRDEQVIVWEEAQRLSGNNVSQLIIKLLADWVDSRPRCSCGTVKHSDHRYCPNCGKQSKGEPLS